jgi:hypothetical protein
MLHQLRITLWTNCGCVVDSFESMHRECANSHTLKGHVSGVPHSTSLNSNSGLGTNRNPVTSWDGNQRTLRWNPTRPQGGPWWDAVDRAIARSNSEFAFEEESQSTTGTQKGS